MAAELDLTNGHLPNLESVDIHEGLIALDLTANRLKDVDPRILALTGLRTLNFRQNLLPSAAAAALAGAPVLGSLQDLELRDNQLTEVPDLAGAVCLTRLELSYNEIRSLSPLSSLHAPQLAALYVAANKVRSVACLEHLTALTTLELGSNRLADLQGLQGQALLRELWLGRNRIAAIRNLDHLQHLRRLSLQSNRLESMAGLAACTCLEELYLSHNGIWRLEGLATLTRLKVLDVSNNRISRLEQLDGLALLEDLWLNHNAIPSLDGLEEALASQRDSLTTIYLDSNPAAAAPDYRRRLLAALPRLQQLDADVLEEPARGGGGRAGGTPKEAAAP